jgi:predicted phage terminase large subunit-like protein
MEWNVVYKKAIEDDGSLFFPERLTESFLFSQRKTMGSYFYANQYQNEIVPLGDQPFKKEWLRYFEKLPDKLNTFAFIDPALSETENADFTALTVISTDIDRNWYLRLAQRFRINPTQIVDLCFKVQEKFNPLAIGIEDVAFQKALLYMISEEMRRRGKVIPISGIKPSTDKSKEMRILGLVPRFEWGTLYIAQGMHDFETEYSQFPRASHDDLLDSLQYMEQLVSYPEKEKINYENLGPNHPDYEKWYREKLQRGLNKLGGEGEYY